MRLRRRVRNPDDFGVIRVLEDHSPVEVRYGSGLPYGRIEVSVGGEGTVLWTTQTGSNQ